MKKHVYAYLLVWSLLFTTGCATNKAIQEFTTASASATSRLPVLADDLSESCIRQNQYLAIRVGSFDPLRLRQESETKCIDFQSSEKSFVIANKVLVNYLQTLGKLAGGDIVTYDKNLDKLVNNLGGTSLIPKEKVNAISAVVSFLGQATANRWRRKQVGKAIAAVNTDIQTLISTLSSIVTKDYFQLLQNEQLAAKNLYLGTIKENQKKEPVTIILLQQQWDREFKVLEDRKKTVATYGEILTTIAQGHQLFADKRTTLNKKAVKKEISGYTARLTPLISDINDTF